MSVDIENSLITVDGLNAYLSRPPGGSTGGMLLLPMIAGIGKQLREFADDIASAGVTALSWDPWQGRPGGDETPFDVLSRWMSELDDQSCLQEMSRLADHLFGELGCDRVGTIGWCMGGRFALLLAGRDHRLANVVAYHPTVPGTPAPNHTIDAVGATAEVTAPVMMLYPSADNLVPRKSFQRLEAALLSRAAGPSLIHFYPGAEHGFSARNRHGNPVNKAAYDLSWPQVIAFIRATTLAGTPRTGTA
ncbi:dienelactone hydrolase family protein [Amycolatopsis taiwanensis]|uniref:Carboxymethylenebutenolidase n=1 Tax=Amycolatopsis taiwanensis TaxID=342230 RepID=A0A9W6QYS8_9PSEU|nr:dienelactone hydrolase family protein [Amycolatopsis taiwanensis]GLY66484.1 carboxymethylenebutenolidase [Amycolatopsis taiwanensis]